MASFQWRSSTNYSLIVGLNILIEGVTRGGGDGPSHPASSRLPPPAPSPFHLNGHNSYDFIREMNSEVVVNHR